MPFAHFSPIHTNTLPSKVGSYSPSLLMNHLPFAAQQISSIFYVLHCPPRFTFLCLCFRIPLWGVQRGASIWHEDCRGWEWKGEWEWREGRGRLVMGKIEESVFLHKLFYWEDICRRLCMLHRKGNGNKLHVKATNWLPSQNSLRITIEPEPQTQF